MPAAIRTPSVFPPALQSPHRIWQSYLQRLFLLGIQLLQTLGQPCLRFLELFEGLSLISLIEHKLLNNRCYLADLVFLSDLRKILHRRIILPPVHQRRRGDLDSFLAEYIEDTLMRFAGLAQSFTALTEHAVETITDCMVENGSTNIKLSVSLHRFAT